MSDATAGDVLRDGLRRSVELLVDHVPVIRADEDPEGIHQARVGLRHLRSDLRTFAELLDPAWAAPLRDELGWLAGELGAVRDLDVLADDLRAAIHRLGGDAPLAAGHLDRLAAERAAAQSSAVAALSEPRFDALLDQLRAAAHAPRTTAPADAPATEVVPRLAGAGFAKLRKAVRRLPAEPADEALHAVRIKAKRARYAVDIAVPVVGKPAKRTAKAIGRLQDVLGEHHDRAVAEAWLRSALEGATAGEGFATGLLVADQRQRAAALRARWRDTWAPLDRPARPNWMRG